MVARNGNQIGSIVSHAKIRLIRTIHYPIYQQDALVKFEEYRQLDGLALAQLVREGQVSAEELLNTAWARLEAVNPKLNFLVTPLRERAMHQVRQAGAGSTGPFGGVPFLTKDLFQDIAGVPNYNGCRALRQAGHVSLATGALTQRWLDAGVVVLGTTNTPEFGSKGVTEPTVSGVTANPWNLALTTGGSSGGSAAAVAAGVVPLAGANDGGGSIRIPAACCGLFGLKPGRGRNPWGPQLSEYMHGGVMGHVLTRSVRDSAAMLDATHGAETGSLTVLAPPVRPYLEEVSRPPGKLRIAFSTQSPLGLGVDPSVVASVQRTVALLQDLGHEVQEAQPDIDFFDAARKFMMLWCVQVRQFVLDVMKQTGCGWDGFEPDTRSMCLLGQVLTASEYLDAHTVAKSCNMAMGHFFERHDVWLTPTLATPPGAHHSTVLPAWQGTALNLVSKLGLTRAVVRAGALDQLVRDNMAWLPFTQLANLTGLPAMSVPLFTAGDGLPSGVHFMGPMGQEGLLFRLAGQLEQAQPWQNRFPSI
jgi:amidase